jgi:hypothetical protein
MIVKSVSFNCLPNGGGPNPNSFFGGTIEIQSGRAKTEIILDRNFLNEIDSLMKNYALKVLKERIQHEEEQI